MRPAVFALSLVLAAGSAPLHAQNPVGDGPANVDPVAPVAAVTPGGDGDANPVPATPAAARLAAADQRARLAAASPVAEVPFRSVGPTVMSGRAVSVVGKPGDPSRFYVGYASGGLWRTDNGGATLTPLFDSQPAITIGDVAVDWADPEGDGPTVWVGTGESNSSRSS